MFLPNWSRVKCMTNDKLVYHKLCRSAYYAFATIGILEHIGCYSDPFRPHDLILYRLHLCFCKCGIPGTTNDTKTFRAPDVIIICLNPIMVARRFSIELSCS